MPNEITSIQTLLSALDKAGIGKEAHAHKRFWFRGHSRLGWLLVPGVYRDKFVSKNEEDRLRLEQNLTQDFRIQSSGLRLGRHTYAEIYFLQQHYSMPTRLLDWTTSPLAALHFAVRKRDEPDVDGELFWMDAYQLKFQNANQTEVFDGIGSQRHGYFANALKPIFDFGKVSDFPNYIFAVRPDYGDIRINSQSSCFTFHVPNRRELTVNENRRLQSLKIPAASKNRIREELFLLGVDDFSIFGDLEGLAGRLCAAYSL